MTDFPDKKSVITTYTNNALILIVLSAIAVGGCISIFSLYKFINESKRLEQENLHLHKSTLKREVTRVSELISYYRSKLDSTIRKNIKDRVYEAHGIATRYFEKYRHTKSIANIESMVIDALRPQRFFDERGYFYAISLDGVGKLNPITPQFEGTNMLSFQTQKGDYYIRELINIAKMKGEGFYHHTWSKPDNQGVFEKVSFVKKFAPFGWLIGTGDYIVDVERQIKNNILEQIGEIRFGREGHIHVVDNTGTVLVGPQESSIIGKKLAMHTDPIGVDKSQSMIQRAQDPAWDGFIGYAGDTSADNRSSFLLSTQEISTSGKISPLLAYYQTVPEWGWYYGAEIQTDDINKEIDLQRNELKERLFLQLLFTITTIIVAVAILLYLSKKRASELNSDLGRLLYFFESLSLKAKPLSTDKFTYSEFNRLADSANLMLVKQQKSEEQRQKYEEQIQQNQKMTAINQMVGGISHDFNNLLGAILGFGELLEMQLGNDKRLQGYAHQINTAGKRGAKLTNKLLSLTRNRNVETEPCNINALLRDEKELLEKSLTAKINLKMLLQDKLWQVLINKSDFEDVILNLCVNAMHAMPEDQCNSEIIISTDHVQISNRGFRLYDLAAGDYVRITVSDNGIGMDSKTKERIFEPFFTTRDTGHGLGLSQVYSFVKQVGGAVSVLSTPGAGTSIEILIPRDTSCHNVLDKKSASIDCDISGRETILVVDDEAALRELNTAILSQKGYRVLQAENGVQALSILEKETVDLVLSDVIMPEMDGNILAENIRNRYPSIKIQLVSGFTKLDEFPNSNQDLYENLLSKPVSTKELLSRITFLLSSNTTHRAASPSTAEAG